MTSVLPVLLLPIRKRDLRLSLDATCSKPIGMRGYSFTRKGGDWGPPGPTCEEVYYHFCLFVEIFNLPRRFIRRYDYWPFPLSEGSQLVKAIARTPRIDAYNLFQKFRRVGTSVNKFAIARLLGPGVIIDVIDVSERIIILFVDVDNARSLVPNSLDVRVVSIQVETIGDSPIGLSTPFHISVKMMSPVLMTLACNAIDGNTQICNEKFT